MVQMENGSSDDHGADRPLSYADLVRWFVIVALVVLGVAVAIAIKETLLLFAIAFLIAMVLNPAVSLLERRGLKRGLAVGLLIIVLLATLALVVFLIVPPFFEQLQQLIEQIRASGADCTSRFKAGSKPTLLFSKPYLATLATC
jgi:predicted PurR-regulated permease PerM